MHEVRSCQEKPYPPTPIPNPQPVHDRETKPKMRRSTIPSHFETRIEESVHALISKYRGQVVDPSRTSRVQIADTSWTHRGRA
jgi:hypothetical protein